MGEITISIVKKDIPADEARTFLNRIQNLLIGIEGIILTHQFSESLE